MDEFCKPVRDLGLWEMVNTAYGYDQEEMNRIWGHVLSDGSTEVVKESQLIDPDANYVWEWGTGTVLLKELVLGETLNTVYGGSE